MNSQVQEAVDQYREYGLIPFPVCKPSQHGCLQHANCEKPGKRPLVKSWTELTELDDTAVDNAFDKDKWNCNIGLRTGLKSGLIVLDIDGVTLEGKELPPGPTVSTGRIGGFHHWFKPTAAIQKKIGLLDGIDFMAEGGYVLAPPSFHHSGTQYKFVGDSFYLPWPKVPDWILEIQPKQVNNNPSSNPELVKLGMRARNFLENGCISGQREEALNAVVNMMGQGIDKDIIYDLVLSSLTKKCPQTDPRNPWQYYHVDDMIYSIEKQGGPKPAKALDKAPSLEINEPRKLARFSPLVHILKEEQNKELAEPLIEGILDKGEFLWLFAPPNSGKTFLVMDWAMHIAAGRTYQGIREVQKSRVMIIEQDRRTDPIRYLEAHIEYGNWTNEELEENLLMAQDSDFNLRTKEGLLELLAFIDESEPELVVMDSCAQFCANGVVDSDYIHVQAFKENMKKRGIAVILLDHTVASPEFGQEENKKSDLDKLYGGQAKRKILDTGVYMKGYLKAGQVELIWAKVQGPEKEPLIISYNPREGFEVRVKFDPSKFEWNTSQKAIAEALSKSGTLTLDNLSGATGLSERTIQRWLPGMVHREQVVRTHVGGSGKGDSARYRLGSKVSGVLLG